MANRRVFTASSLAATASLGLGGVASAQGQGQGPGGNNQAARFAQVLAGLINAAVNIQNVAVQNNLNNLLRDATFLNNVNILNLTDVLNGNQIQILSDLVDLTNVLNDNTITVNILNNALNNNTILNNLLQNANIVVNDVLAIDVLSGTFFVFPR